MKAVKKPIVVEFAKQDGVIKSMRTFIDNYGHVIQIPSPNKYWDKVWNFNTKCSNCDAKRTFYEDHEVSK